MHVLPSPSAWKNRFPDRQPRSLLSAGYNTALKSGTCIERLLYWGAVRCNQLSVEFALGERVGGI